MIINGRIYEWHEGIGELPPDVTHIRSFIVDPTKPKVNGLLQYADTKRIDAWVEYVTEEDLDVVWTLNMTKDRTLADELAIVNSLVDRGVNITHFEYGGEFYLPKYYNGDDTNSKVVERVRIPDYLQMLNDWLPVFVDAFPEARHCLMAASHQNGTNQAERYRKQWTDACIQYKQDNDPDDILGFSFHYYAGAKPDWQPSNGEEVIYKDIDFSPFIGQVRDVFPDAYIIIPESGWYRGDNSYEQFTLMSDFYEAGVSAIGDNGIMGLHVLNSRGGSFAWWKNGVLTDVGEYFLNYFAAITEPPLEPVLQRIRWENVNEGWIFTTYSQGLEFSDEFRFNTYRLIFGKPRGYLATSQDIGKPLSYFIENGASLR